MLLLEVRSFIGTHDKDWEDERLWSHPDIEISVVLEGSGRFRGRDQERAVNAGHVVLIPPNLPHSFHAVTPIRFGVLLIRGLPARIRELFERLIQDGFPRIIALSGLDQDHYERLFREWLRIRSSKLKEPERNYMAWIEMLLLFLNEHSHSDQQALSISHTGDYIREHLQDAVQISALAEMCGLSEEGFRKRFSKVYGMTPKQYQQMCRLAEAKWQLSSTDRDMQSIAQLIGFTGLHSFSLWFKKLEDCPPSEWRTRQRLYHV
ncbi:helix-turn-helix domain-containing protein [Paenibacillus sp. HJL G12]|uniref:Helix-turn-helix domain-containing protein n=1 Tax=Paenibacillus dendrobii TaxID=2691084 RepID=A0A7X3IPG2_9BACL|nr:AraC family transcriptional regulator [Paenibacillus dendrobii]MWV47263.1 helix-turn-helix domain-containing protein [Paenibacillus dendrobii]